MKEFIVSIWRVKAPPRFNEPRIVRRYKVLASTPASAIKKVERLAKERLGIKHNLFAMAMLSREERVPECWQVNP